MNRISKNTFILLIFLFLWGAKLYAFDDDVAYTFQLMSNDCYLKLQDTSNSGSSSTAASYTDSPESTFYLKQQTGGFTIQSAESELYMGWKSWNVAATTSSSLWKITQVEEDAFYIQRTSGSGYLGIGNNGDNGKIYTDCSSATLWRIVPVGSTPTPSGGPSELIINEVTASNLGEAMDPSYNFGAWVELYNPTDAAVQLTGVIVSDDKGNSFTLNKYHGSVPAHGFKNLWFGHYSNDNTHYSSSYKTYKSQVDMDLDCDGGYIAISYNGETLDEVTYPEAISRCSWARTTDGGDDWSYCGWPSSESSNVDCLFSASQLPAPEPSNHGGRFSGSISVSVPIPDGASLCYTTDGSVPTKNNGKTIASTTSASFTISETSFYRFRFVADDRLPSRVVTCSYIKNASSGTNILSVVTDDDYLYDTTVGIYVDGTNNGSSLGGWSYWKYANYYQDWDRPVNVEIFDSDDSIFIDQEANMAISGGKPRANEHKSFKLKTAKEFNGLNFYQTQGIFERKPYNRYKDFMVRAGGETDYDRNLDNTLQKILIASGVYVDAQDYRPVEVYLNGEDRGLFFVRETTNKQFGASNYGMDTDEMDTFEENDIIAMSLKTGTWDAFNELYSTAKQVQSSDEAWERIHSLLDVEEYINYFAAETYLSNYDWPQNNFKMFRDYSDGRFHAVVQDLDWATYDSAGPFRHIDNQSSSFPYAEIGSAENKQLTIFLNLMNRPEFCRQFIDTFCLMAGSVYDPDFVNEEISSLQEELTPYYASNTSELSSALTSISSLLSQSIQTKRIGQLKSWSRAGLSSATSISTTLSTNIDDGRILLNGLLVPRSKFSGTLFLPVTLEACAPRGYEFTGWKRNGIIVSTDETISLTMSGSYQAVYEKTGTGLPPVVVNEVGASNEVYINDLLKRTDWIELFNTTDEDIDLAGMYLSDDSKNKQKYMLPSAIIPAHGHKIIWADKKNGKTDLHCNFKLANDSNSVVTLTAADGSWSDVLSYHPQTGRQSVGRFPDGGENIYLFDIPSIGRQNLITTFAKLLEFVPLQPTIGDLALLIQRMLDGNNTVTLDDIEQKAEEILR